MHNSVYIIVILSALMLFGPAEANHSHTVDLNEIETAHQTALPLPAQAWDQLLKQHIHQSDNGLARFDYKAVKESEKDYDILSDYIAFLEQIDPSTLNDTDALVFWANLYNAVTVKLIVDHYPVTSIRKIKSGLFSSGPWNKKLISINGEALSLNNVEHDIMRQRYASPLIHYMVNCASIGCPNLKQGVWRVETLQKDQVLAAKSFINSPRGVRVNEDGFEVSSIYKWFKEDFGGSKAMTLAHLKTYADADVSNAIDAGLKIESYDYNWSLNGVE